MTTRNRPFTAIQVSPFLTRGGTETVIYQLASYQQRLGDRMVCLGEPGYIADCLREIGITTYQVNGLALRNPITLTTTIRRLAKLLKRLGPDAITSHSFIAAIATALACRASGLRPLRIYIVHIPERSWYFKMIGRLTKHIADVTVTICREVADRLVANGLSPSRVVTIYNGIDVAGVAHRAPPSHLEHIGVIARLVRRKGHRFLLDAVSQLDHHDFVLHFYGDGEEEASLRHQAHSLGLSDKVVFHGFCSDVSKILTGLDLVVLPSTREGLPMVLLEAMAAGVPVVASAVNGIPELIIDGVCGKLVAPGDPAALAQALASLQGNSRELSRLAHAGRKRVEDHFALNRSLRYHRRLVHIGSSGTRLSLDK